MHKIVVHKVVHWWGKGKVVRGWRYEEGFWVANHSVQHVVDVFTRKGCEDDVMRKGFWVAFHSVQHEVEVFYEEGMRGWRHEEEVLGKCTPALTGNTVRQDDSSKQTNYCGAGDEKAHISRKSQGSHRKLKIKLFLRFSITFIGNHFE